MIGPSSRPAVFRSIYTFPHLPIVDEEARPSLQPQLGQILRFKRVRLLAIASVFLASFALILSESERLYNFDYSKLSWPSRDQSLTIDDLASNIDWSRFAYTQYATNSEYLCNSVMIFETLSRLGSKADRLLMYPSTMTVDEESNNTESKLLLKAEREYGVKLRSIEIRHRDLGDDTWQDSYTKLLAFNQTEYDRVLSLDSDSTVLQHMDELFLAPSAHVAMPRAYWLENPYLSSQMILIQPSTEEFKRIDQTINNVQAGEFDMEIVNILYGKDCMILPHRPYNLLTGEFRSKGNHTQYLGNEYEGWNPENVLQEAKFLHFSDWPMPKPWLSATTKLKQENQPNCDVLEDGREDCRARDLWLGFYEDFKARRKNVCG